MIKGEYDKLKEMADTQLCAEHKLPLEVAWHAGEDDYVLLCSKGHYPDAVTPKETEIQAMRRSANIALPIGAFALPDTDLGSKAALTVQQQRALVDYARHYGLDAYRGHVCIMYGKPYIGIDGYLYKANKSKRPYRMPSRPMTDEERTQYQVGDKDIAWLCELDTLAPASYHIGIGIVRAEELTEEAKGKPGQLRYPVVAAHPQLLAQKRAEWQALRRGFPIGEDEEKKDETGDKGSVSG